MKGTVQKGSPIDSFLLSRWSFWRSSMLLREDYRTEEHNAAKPQPQEGIVSAEKSQGSRLTQLLLRKVQCQRRNDQKINESAFWEAVGRQALPPIPTILIHASGRVSRPTPRSVFSGKRRREEAAL
jgi:hypothetical protein